MNAILVAAVACALYVGISLLVGELFLFSRYSMYAKLTTRTEGAVLYVRVGDRFVAPDDLDAVWGIDVPALDPTRVPCSQQWVVYEAQRWLTRRAAGALPEGALPEGALPLEIGYRMLRIGPGGGIEERLAPVTSGSGRLRR